MGVSNFSARVFENSGIPGEEGKNVEALCANSATVSFIVTLCFYNCYKLEFARDVSKSM